MIFFVQKKETPLSGLFYFLFGGVFLLSSFIFDKKSSFFVFLGFEQFFLLFLSGVFLFLIFLSSVIPKFHSILLKELIAGLFLFLTGTFAFIFLENKGFLYSYGLIFIISGFLANELFIDFFSRKKRIIYAFFTAFILTQISFLLAFIPFTPFLRATAVTAFALLFIDIVSAYVINNGVIKKGFIVEKCIILLFFLIFFGFFTSWRIN